MAAMKGYEFRINHGADFIIKPGVKSRSGLSGYRAMASNLKMIVAIFDKGGLISTYVDSELSF